MIKKNREVRGQGLEANPLAHHAVAVKSTHAVGEQNKFDEQNRAGRRGCQPSCQKKTRAGRE